MAIRQLYLNILVLLAASAVHAQQKPIQVGETASDCLGAITINDTVLGPVISPKGFGRKLEISDYELGDPYFIQREHNTVWYKFTAPYDAILSFDLVPIRKDDDFDFLLFKYDGPNFCQEIMDGTKIPIRTNISRKNIEVGGMTGLREGMAHDYMPSGPGSSYSRPVKVKQGAVLYLLVDNPFRENEGHSIYLHYKRVSSPEPAAPESGQEVNYEMPMGRMRVTVTEAGTGQRLASEIYISGLPDSIPARYAGVSQVEVDVVGYRTYDINVVKQGYLLAHTEVIPKQDSLYAVAMTIKPLAVGDRINLENIKFQGDEAILLEKSISALNQLVAFLRVNNKIAIEIQGHVNGESKRNKRSYRRLSEQRAEAVYDKLIEAGIDPQRMVVKGYGNSQMIYPTPINDRQAEANRRVEVEVRKL